MKIVILSKFSGKVERGVETWATNLQKRLEDEVVIISGNFLIKIGKWLNADIIIPTNGRFQVLIVRLITWIVGKPMIVFGHSGPGADDKWNLLCIPDYFVSFSKAQKKWVDQFKFKTTESVVINHAVDTSVFKPLPTKHKGKVVLCVAANTPTKRVELVREAVRQLKGVKLRVVGSGQEEVMSHNKMPKVYNSADVFCFVPQPWEAFGLVYLEAMACNLPVVTINDSVRQEIVGNAGELVKDPEDIKSLAMVLKRALNTNRGNKPRSQALKFSWNLTQSRYKSLFIKAREQANE